MKWALADPARFLRERAELDRLEAEVDWLTTAWRVDPDWNIEVDIDMQIQGRLYAGRLTYPDVFPDSPPYIRPRNQSERWSSHQYGEGGSLCLQWRADNWQTDVTGAELVRSAFVLLNTEQNTQHPGVVPSAHRVTEGQSMRDEEYRFVATPSLFAELGKLPLNTIATIKTNTVLHRTATVAFISGISAPGIDYAEITDLPKGIANYFPLFAMKGQGIAFRSDTLEMNARIDSVDALRRAVGGGGLSSEDIAKPDEATGKSRYQLILLIGESVQSMRAFSIDAVDLHKVHENRIIKHASQALRLPKEYERLAAVRFGIVGLGSIGSKVAASLARSGAKRFLLIDDDFLTPANICRHELTWSSVGVHKVDAVKDEISLLMPDVEVNVRRHRVAGQESALAAAAALKDLSSCDVLIDATANPEVFVRLSGIAKANQRALCWGELFAGGFGGIIARARPDLDPNPLAVRSAIHSYLGTLPPAPFQTEGGYDTESEQPQIAYDSDVGEIAALVTRLALDTALKRVPSNFPYPAYLIGMRKEWDFDQPFDTRPIDARGEGWSVPVTASDTDRASVVKALLGIAEAQGANTNPSP